MDVGLRLERKFQTEGGIAHQPVGVRKLDWLPFRAVSKYRQCIAQCDQNSSKLKTDGRHAHGK